MYEGESPYYVPFFIEAYVAVSVLDVLLYKFFIGIAAGPLFHVSAFAHNALSCSKSSIRMLSSAISVFLISIIFRNKEMCFFE